MLSVLVSAAVAAATPMTIPGPSGPIAGTFTDAGKGAPVVLIIPGSGSTDRDGNNPMGVAAAPYRLLAEGLAARGVSTLRADKRGLFESKGAIPDPNKVTIADYAGDAHQWAAALRERTGAKCVWLLGHSEGGLIALSAVQKPADLCGIIVVAGPGRKLGTVIRDQLKANPANAPLLAQANAALDSLEAGNSVDASSLPAPLQPLFATRVQPFLMDMLAKDPAALAAQATLPMLIIQGGKDIQVARADAEALHAAQPKAKLLILENMNHVLKDVAGDDRAANIATYADPALPLDSGLVDAIAGFVKR
ncbi:MAG: alpha/beta fold hydrolase [Pseudomonadota bacterium]